MTKLTIIQPGLLATLQDLGRKGYFRSGLTQGGAMDEYAFRWANALLGNHPNDACIEVLMGQFEAEFDSSAMIGVTGADWSLHLNDQPITHWASVKVKAGDKISFNKQVSGLRAYIAISGGWQTPVQFGSRSTILREGLGGLDGEKLKAGQTLDYLKNPYSQREQREIAQEQIPDYQADLELKVVPGYQFDQFTRFNQLRFFYSEYQLTGQMDRMGYRLQGPAVKTQQQNLISEGIALGSIQVPPDGQPIILLKDRQTIGGYPKLGCVASLDTSRLSQKGPGDKVRFLLSDIATVQIERQLFNQFFAKLSA